MNAIDDYHEEKNTHKFSGKCKVKVISCSKNRDNLSWTELEQKKSDKGYNKIAGNGKFINTSYPVVLLCSIIKADDWLGTLRDSYDNSQ